MIGQEWGTKFIPQLQGLRNVRRRGRDIESKQLRGVGRGIKDYPDLAKPVEQKKAEKSDTQETTPDKKAKLKELVAKAKVLADKGGTLNEQEAKEFTALSKQINDLPFDLSKPLDTTKIEFFFEFLLQNINT